MPKIKVFRLLYKQFCPNSVFLILSPQPSNLQQMPKMPKMPRIMVSLRCVLLWTDIWRIENQKSVNEYNSIPCFFLSMKSIEYLNFRHFRHFAILGISLGNLIFTQKYLATKCTNLISKRLSYNLISLEKKSVVFLLTADIGSKIWL